MKIKERMKKYFLEEPPEEFKKYGYSFKLLKRKQNVLLYSQGKKGRVLGYEIHVWRAKTGNLTPQSGFGQYA